MDTGKIAQYILEYREYPIGAYRVIERRGQYILLNRYGVRVTDGDLAHCVERGRQLAQYHDPDGHVRARY